jgi:PAS domain S-box-containing protein
VPPELVGSSRAPAQCRAELAAVVAAPGDAIISVGTDLTVRTWSTGAQRLLGYSEVEARGRAITDLIVPDVHVAEVSAIYAAAARGRIGVLKATVCRRRDGCLVPTETSISPILAGAAKVTGFSIIVRDISERRRAEEEQARLAAIVTSSAVVIMSETLDGIVTSWNAAAERMFGYPASEMVGQSIRYLIPVDRQPEEDAILARLARNERIDSYETKHFARDGRVFDALINVSPLRNGEGGVIGVSKIISDITERKKTEARLAEREAQLALFIEHAPACIAMFDNEMRTLAISRRFLSDFRVPDTMKVIGVSHYQMLPDVPPRWREVHARVLAGEELSADEDPFVRQDGHTDWCRWSMKPWRTADGRVGGALLGGELITAQVEAKRALADSEARFRATFENAAVGIAHLAPDLRWLRANEALCRILGYPVDELVTKSLQDISYPDDLAADLAHIELMRDGKINSYDMDKRYLRKDSAIIWARLTVGCVRKSDDGSIDYFVEVVEDITARKHAEEELRKSEERFRSSLVHSPLPVLLYDDREQILALSQTWLEESGYAKQELRCMDDWTARACGERSDEALKYFRRVISTEPEVQRVERVICTKDGRERLWSLVSSALGGQSDGRRLFITVAQDVTEQKAHEEQVHLLMREVNHRAKNMLSLVQAIARQTAAREPEDFIDRFTERIQALAANQDLLVRNEWRGVDVEDLACAQLAHFADLVGSRITVHGEKLHLNAAAAQAIGLALHELATNAGKYGALSAAGGRVEVCWGMAGRDTFTMNWTEREGPPVSAPTQRGFGSIVMERMAERSVGGSVDLDYAPSGLTWRLTCPAANALEWRGKAMGANGDGGRDRWERRCKPW